MNKKTIYKKIAQLAIELKESNRVYTRSDLAFELNDEGIKADSKLIENLVFEAYESTSNPNTKDAIMKSFVNNSFSRKLIDKRSAEYLLRDENLDDALVIIKDSALSKADKIYSYSDELSNLIENIGDFIVKKKVVDRLSGSIQVNEVKAEAQHIYESYIKICDGYLQARLDMLALIDDFVSLRSEILRKYKESASILVDVFGPQIKKVAPVLFDFDKISFLDVESMQKNITLELDKVLLECGELIGELNQKFLSDISNSSSLMGKGGNNNIAIVSVAQSFLMSWATSAEKATHMRQKLEVMKNSINRDSQTIKKDLIRLTAVQKTINDVFIPKAFVFQRHMKNVLTNDLDEIFNILESHPSMGELNRQKKELLDKEQLIEKTIIDHKKEIESNKFNINNNENLLEAYRPLYINAKSAKPIKPWIFIGALNKKYNRNLSEWNNQYATIMREFDEVQSDIKIEKEDLESHQKSLSIKERELNNIQRKLLEHSKKTQKTIRENTNLQNELAQHLTPLVNLLRAARAVVEQKLEDDLTQTKSVEKIELDEMTDDMQEKLFEFTSVFREEVPEVETNEKGTLEAMEDRLEIRDIEIANTMVNLLDEVIKLGYLEYQGVVANHKYNADVNQLRDEYQVYINKLDNKSLFINKLLKKANTGSIDEVSAALTLLGQGDSITEKEIISSLKNNKNINL